MGVIGELCYNTYRSCPSGTIKIKRVHTPLSQSLSIGVVDIIQGSMHTPISQPLGIGTVDIIQSYWKVLTLLISPLCDDINPTSLLVLDVNISY